MTADDAIFIFSALTSLGAALGAVGITMGELFYARALADGKLENYEREYIRATFWSLRWGMTLVLFASVATILAEYLALSTPQHVLTASFWLTITAALVIILAGWGLSRRKIPWWLGSAAGFSGWWTIFALSTWRDLPYSYGTLAFAYLIGTGIVAGIFAVIRGSIRTRNET